MFKYYIYIYIIILGHVIIYNISIVTLICIHKMCKLCIHNVYIICI